MRKRSFPFRIYTTECGFACLALNRSYPGERQIEQLAEEAFMTHSETAKED
jgi:hypothetical protein